MNNAQIVYNGIQTPDGSIICSNHRHDFVSHIDATNGEEYAVDGGTYYLRRLGKSDTYKEMSLYAHDPHSTIRHYVEWGTRGKGGRQPVKQVIIKDLDTDHIEAILATQYQIPDWMRAIFKNELIFRIPKPQPLDEERGWEMKTDQRINAMSKEYEIKQELLNILSICHNDDFECGVRGWVKPESVLQYSSWSIHLNKPWRVSDEDEEELKASEQVRRFVENGTSVYTRMGDEGIADWSKKGLVAFRNAINEVLTIWDDLDEQEKEHNG